MTARTKTEHNYTQGPWKSDPGDGTIYMGGVPLDVRASDLSPASAEYKEAMANARLIAAAPDLLETLMDILPTLKLLPEARRYEAIDIVETAIANALT